MPAALLAGAVLLVAGLELDPGAQSFQEEVGGPLRDGEAGVRLLEASGTLGYFGEAPPPFELRAGQWLVVPSYSLFGSEELSVLSSGVAARVPAPCALTQPGRCGQAPARRRIARGRGADGREVDGGVARVAGDPARRGRPVRGLAAAALRRAAGMGNPRAGAAGEA